MKTKQLFVGRFTYDAITKFPEHMVDYDYAQTLPKPLLRLIDEYDFQLREEPYIRFVYGENDLIWVVPRIDYKRVHGSLENDGYVKVCKWIVVLTVNNFPTSIEISVNQLRDLLSTRI